QRGMNATTDSSDSQGEQVEEFVEYYTQYRAVNYVNLAAFVVILFDYLITIDCEVRSACCMALNYTMQTVVALLYGVWAAFSGLRIYAISNHNRFVTWSVVLLALVPVGTNIYLESQITDIYSEDTGCMATISLSTDTAQSLSLGRTLISVTTRASLTVSEAIVIVVTWMKTWATARTPLPAGSRPSFTALVLREGILFFCVVLTFNIIQIIFTFVESSTFSLILQFLNVLTPILISRFYFDLDDFKDREATASLPSVRSPTLRFKSSSTRVSLYGCIRLIPEYTLNSLVIQEERRSEGSYDDHAPFTQVKVLPLREGYPLPGSESGHA
ncbi:hypothetical protein BV20DRAFT_934912, partial [Pilatotrama ljubarskyi]